MGETKRGVPKRDRLPDCERCGGTATLLSASGGREGARFLYYCRLCDYSWVEVEH